MRWIDRPWSRFRACLLLALVATTALAPAVRAADDLARAHAALAANRLVEAGSLYAKVAADPQRPATSRAEAWRGLGVVQALRLEMEKSAVSLGRALLADPEHPLSAVIGRKIAVALSACGRGPQWPGVLDSLVAAAAAHPGLRAPVICLRFIDADIRGAAAERDSLMAQLHPPSDFYVLGPFENAGGLGIDVEDLAAGRIDLGASYHDLLGRPITWLRVTTWHPGWLDLDQLLDDEPDAFAYALTHVKPARGPVEAVGHLHGGGSFQVWVDGRTVLREAKNRSGQAPLYEFPVTLRDGWNRVLIKAGSETESLGLSLFFTDLDGVPLDVQVDPDPGVQAAGPPAAAPAGPAADAATCPEGLDRLPPQSGLARFRAGAAAAPLPDRYLEIDHLVGQGFADEAAQQIAGLRERFPDAAIVEDLQADADAFLQPGEVDSRRRRVVAMAPELLVTRLAVVSDLSEEEGEEEAWRQMEALLAAAPDNAFLLSMHGAFQVGRGSLQPGLQEMQRAVQASPGNLAAWMIYLKVQESLSDAEAETQVALAQQARPDVPDLARWAAGLAYKRQQYDKALQLLEAALAAAARPREVLTDKAEVLRQLGRTDEAVATLEEALRWSPMSEDVHHQLAELLLQDGREQEALPHLERCVQLDAKDFDDREMIRTIRGEPPLRELFPATDVEEVARTDLSWVDEDAVGAVLLDAVELTVYPDGAVERRHHVIQKVLQSGGIEQLSTSPVPTSGDGEVEIARSLKPDGRRIEAERGFGKVAFSELAVGDLTEVRYVVRWGPHVGLAEHFWTDHKFQYDQPIALSRLSILLPREREYSSRCHNLQLEPRRSRKGDWRLDVWEARRLAVLPEEGDMPPYEEQAAWLDVSTVPDWDAIVRWYDGILRGRLRATPAVRQLAAEIGEGAPDDSTRIQRVVGHLQREYRNVGGSFSESGQVPRPLDTVIRTRFGDCKDQAALVVSLLRQLGVEACVALVSSRDETTVPHLPSPRFSHAIVRARTGEGRVYWIDPTEKSLSFPDVPVLLEGARALLIDPAAPEFVTIAPDPPAANGTSARLEIAVDQDGEISVEGGCDYRGEDAASLRDLQRNDPARVREAVQGMVNVAATGAVLDRYEITGQDVAEPLRLTFGFRGDAGASTVQDLMLLPVPWLFSRAPKNLAALEERRQPLVLDSWKGLYRERLELTLPPGWQLGAETAPVDLACDDGRFHLDCRPAEDGRVIMERELEIRSLRIEPERYPAFREFLRQAIKAEKQPLMLKRTGG